MSGANRNGGQGPFTSTNPAGGFMPEGFSIPAGPAVPTRLPSPAFELDRIIVKAFGNGGRLLLGANGNFGPGVVGAASIGLQVSPDDGATFIDVDRLNSPLLFLSAAFALPFGFEGFFDIPANFVEKRNWLVVPTVVPTVPVTYDPTDPSQHLHLIGQWVPNP